MSTAPLPNCAAWFSPRATTSARLKHKATELLARGKAEKDQRQKAEAEAKLNGKKVAALSDHVEKLMVHLKHEVGAKAQVTDQLRRAREGPGGRRN